LATGEAFRILARGTADLFIVGGTDSKMNPLSIVRLDLLKRLSKFKGDPAEASRPFDADRDGLVAGEGAGMLVLEEARHARDRGATIYGEIVGFGSSCHPSSPGLAIERAAKLALREAGVLPDQLSHVACNGLSCVEEDRVEALALSRLLGAASAKVPVVAYKSYMGFTCAAAGALELIASLLALRHRQLPRTLNFHRQDPDSPRLRILREVTELEPKPFLTYDLSHGGQCGALVVRPFAE
jgi:3-oxoacyl-[acyl-carrier-protein] synthase II